ncbi:MAG: hypothetical protein JNJ54_16695 [Myxococcaceae bacterium]|nr:hypothetical protein [Myxococcaceae bacterium]
MDLISSLSTQLTLSDNAARSLAGQVLGLIEDTMREKVSFGVASRIRNAVPELVQWQATSPTIVPGSLALSEVPMDRADHDEVELVRLLERFRVDLGKRQVVSALTMQFLASRVDAQVLAIIKRTMPLLVQS